MNSCFYVYGGQMDSAVFPFRQRYLIIHDPLRFPLKLSYCFLPVSTSVFLCALFMCVFLCNLCECGLYVEEGARATENSEETCTKFWMSCMLVQTMMYAGLARGWNMLHYLHICGKLPPVINSHFGCSSVLS